MRLPRKAFALTVSLAVAGCSTSPTRPGPDPPPPPLIETAPQIPVAINNSSASVTAEDSFALVYKNGSRFGYGVRFLLRETSGRSGATIDGITVYGPSGADSTGPGCWRDTLRVPALGRLDTFHTAQGADWLVYCAPGSGGTMASPSLAVIVTFTDDFGITGSIRFPASPRG